MSFIERYQEAQSRVKLIRTIASVIRIILFSDISLLIWRLVLLTIPIALLIIGITFNNDCPIDSKLPIWLIASGGSFIVALVLIPQVAKAANPSTAIKGAAFVVVLFIFEWFICGNVLVYRIFATVRFTNEDKSIYCDRFFYLFCFWFINAIWILVIASIVIFLIFFLIIFVLTRSIKFDDESDEKDDQLLSDEEIQKA